MLLNQCTFLSSGWSRRCVLPLAVYAQVLRHFYDTLGHGGHGMDNQNHELLALFKQEYGLTDQQGVIRSYVEGVNFFWSEKSVDFSAMVYPSGIGFILNGSKQGIFGNQQFNYDPKNFLLVTVSTPLICKTIASKENPVYGIFLQSNASVVKEMVMEMGGDAALPNVTTRGVEPVLINDDLKGAVLRLAKALVSPVDSKIIGESLMKEVIYRVLQSEHGRALFDAMSQDTPKNKIATVVDYIKQSYSERITVDHLANLSNMSSSHFHREFRTLMGTSPIQFIKQIRLSKARSLIVHEGKQVTVAADEVGYRNLSQFHRDFKVHFHVTPTQASKSGYAEIDMFSTE